MTGCERDWLFIGSEAGEHAVELPPEILPPVEPPALAREWHETFLSRESQFGVMRAFYLTGGDLAAWHALGRIGAAFADVHAFDGIEGEAPRWRWRLYQNGAAVEDGFDAIILPVDRCGRLLPVFGTGEDFLLDIADLIALPVKGGRARSYTGLTPAFGLFDPFAAAFPPAIDCLTLLANGMRWLAAHVAQARECAGGLSEEAMRAELDELARPDAGIGFVLAPELIEWKRVDAKRIACPDSAGLARTIDAALHAKEKPKPLPEVLGPAREKVAA